MGVSDMESCAIYGLEAQGRALCSHTGEQESIRFYVGTLSPRSEGHVHQIDFDEETNHITRKVYKPKVGEIWQIQCAPSNSNLVALTFNYITDFNSTLKSGLWELPDPKLGENNQELKSIFQFENSERNFENQQCRGVDWHTSKSSRISVVYDKGFAVWDLADGAPQLQSKYCTTESEESTSMFDKGKWNPHLDGNQFSLVKGQNIIGIDTRNMQKVWEFSSAHKFQVRDIDFNPNKQYYFASCGDDCTSRFWDLRKPNECLKEIQEHSHWIWVVRFNTFHDQLILTAGSDSRVVLHSLPSISSEPRGHMLYSEGDEAEEIAQNDNNKKLDEGVLAKYEEHEDAVYVAEWSSYDPWIFASLSYDGRLVINRVPQSQKYKILL